MRLNNYDLGVIVPATARTVREHQLHKGHRTLAKLLTACENRGLAGVVAAAEAELDTPTLERIRADQRPQRTWAEGKTYGRRPV